MIMHVPSSCFSFVDQSFSRSGMRNLHEGPHYLVQGKCFGDTVNLSQPLTLMTFPHHLSTLRIGRGLPRRPEPGRAIRATLRREHWRRRLGCLGKCFANLLMRGRRHPLDPISVSCIRGLNQYNPPSGHLGSPNSIRGRWSPQQPILLVCYLGNQSSIREQ